MNLTQNDRIKQVISNILKFWGYRNYRKNLTDEFLERLLDPNTFKCSAPKFIVSSDESALDT